MHKSQNIDEVKFERYYPQHPLPKEIKDLPEKETICEFCGISYLIHSEIKRLETEIIALNKRIKFYEDIQITEKTYENKYNSAIIKLEQANVNYSSLEDNVRQLTCERDQLQTSLVDRDDKIVQLESSLNMLRTDKDKLTSKQRKIYQSLFELKRNNRLMKDDLSSVKTDIGLMFANNATRNSIDVAHINGVLAHIMESSQSASLGHERAVGTLESEMATLRTDKDRMSHQLLRESDNCQALLERNKKLIDDNNALQHHLQEKDSIISQKAEILKLSNMENETMKSDNQKDLLILKKEIASLDEKNMKLEELFNQEKIFSDKLKCELEATKLKSESISENNLGLSKRITAFEGELKELKELLGATRRNQESIDNEIAKSTFTIKEEFSKLVSEVNLAQYATKDVKFQMESSFNKQKLLYEEEISKLKKELNIHNETEENLKGKEIEIQKLQKSISQYRGENRQLQRQIEDLENGKTIKIQSQCQENDKNIKIIQDLENEITVKENIIDRMEENLIKYNNEIYSLKMMVQQECDERYELTESLNRAREQLLIIGELHSTKTPISLPLIPHKNSNASIASYKTNSSQNSLKKSVCERNNSTNSQHSTNSIISTKRKLERLFNK